MNATSLSLLERLRRRPSKDDWKRLDEIYRPLVRQWLARIPGIHNDVDDLTQEVLLVVLREIARFERQREGSFRKWLRQIAVNRVRGFWRSHRRRPATGAGSDETEDYFAKLEDPASDLSRQWDREHDRFVFDHLLAIVKGDFQAATWEAFRRFALEARPAAQVAAELKMTESAVLLAKSRVLKRLREEAGVLLDKL